MDKLKILTVIGVCIFYGCTNHSENFEVVQPSKEILVGKYVNKYETAAEHYVVLKPDSSYFHYYKLDTVERKQSGKWNLSKLSNGGSALTFYDWISFGPQTGISCNGCAFVTDLAGKEIVFSQDLAEKVNFYKE